MMPEAVDRASMEAFKVKVKEGSGEAQGFQWLKDTSSHIVAVAR